MSTFPAMLHALLLRELGSLRRELQAYPDETSLWEAPPGVPNSGGNLILHLTGNLQHYVGAVLGSTGYVRDRDAEFSSGGMERPALLEQIAAAERAVDATLPALTEQRLAAPYPEPIRGHPVKTGDFLLHVAIHLGYHLGQLDYHRRIVTGDASGVDAINPAVLATARSR
ncbi:MAG: DinB family protein [Gemmatimonadota bacterium]